MVMKRKAVGLERQSGRPVCKAFFVMPSRLLFHTEKMQTVSYMLRKCKWSGFALKMHLGVGGSLTFSKL